MGTRCTVLWGQCVWRSTARWQCRVTLEPTCCWDPNPDSTEDHGPGSPRPGREVIVGNRGVLRPGVMRS